MIIFLENPIRLAVIATAVTLGVWIVTRDSSRRTIRLMPLGVAVLGMLVLLWERSVVTLREELSAVLHSIARDIESNDYQRIIQHVSETAPDLTRDASRYVPRYTFHRVKVKRNLQVEQQSPHRAVARFNTVFLVSETRGDARNILSPWYFIVELVREDGTWKVAAYERRRPL